jgi:myo-inositol-1-phosphate synthase
MDRKVGIWIIGACGSVATCAVTGAEALKAGIIPTSGLVTELSDFKDLGLVRFDQMVFGGHEIRATTASSRRRSSRPSGLRSRSTRRTCAPA